MKIYRTTKLELLLLLCACTFPVQAQDTVRVKHSNYDAVFSKSKKYPVLVEWWVTTKKIQCTNPVKRNDKFLPDPALPVDSDISDDYVGSGFDRGHLSPAADNVCNGPVIMAESFYFTNRSERYPEKNSLRLSVGTFRLVLFSSRNGKRSIVSH